MMAELAWPDGATPSIAVWEGSGAEMLVSEGGGECRSGLVRAVFLEGRPGCWRIDVVPF